MTRRTIRTATCSALALATALAAAPAAAQSFQGSSTVTFGSAVVTEGSGTTDVQVNSNSAVIDWSPDDTATGTSAPILFQPAGTTATFHNDPTLQNGFAVLNRINPADATRAIIFDGSVISRLQQGAGQVAGGTVFFYSPGGIIVGANAVFDVGNLGLTTAAPVVDGNGNWYTGNQVQFQQAASDSFVQINAGAQITASSESSYVAAFSPYIRHSGTIDVNGQAALVAAEAGTITFSPDGLFDIQVSIGTDGQSGNGILHEGTTTGSASSGVGDNHRIYMVAIPKNQALTLAVTRGSEIGFDVAGAADVVGNSVVLSAGRQISGGTIVGGPGSNAGVIDINDSSTGGTGSGIDFTSGVTADATDDIIVNVFRQTNFASNASLHATNMVQVAVGTIPSDSIGNLSVGGNLTLSTDGFTPFATAPNDGGITLLFVNDGASASVAGDLILAADAVFDSSGDGVVTGGFSQLSLDGAASLSVDGNLFVRASAFTDSTPILPGLPTDLDAVGGSAQVFLSGGSDLSVAGFARVHSYGSAGFNTGSIGNGADGTGGFSLLSVTEGATATVNELNVAADGTGGVDAGSGGGSGFGGVAQINVGGAGSALTVQLPNITGDFTLGQLELLSAEGIGGNTSIAGSSGGDAQGGTAQISVTNGGNLALPAASGTNLVRIIARATGGSASADGSTGGNAAGGSVNVFLDNGTLTGDGFLFSSFAQGGNAVLGATGSIDGGDAIGGNRSITIQNGSTFSGSANGGPGAVGGRGSATGNGGNGSGGLATLLVDNSTLNVSALGFLSFSQNAGGSGGVGGNASGGNSFAQISNGATVNLVSGSRFLIGAGNTGNVFDGASDAIGGNATGGNATLLVSNATITGPGTVEVSAVASGGSVLQGQGGNGTGGTAHLQLQGAAINVADILVNASGNGGSADPFLLTPPPASLGAGNGGNGTGGVALITADSGVNTLTATALDLDADGEGGSASGSSGNGGIGTGGQSRLAVQPGASLAVNGSVALSADAEGGVAGTFDPVTGEFTGIGTGGDAFGGNAQIAAINGTLTVSGDAEVEGVADGGMGLTGGNAMAGSFLMNSNGGSIAIGGNVLIESGASGGQGSIFGGDASGSLDDLTLVNSFLQAENGGSVSVGGMTRLRTEIEGGAGLTGGSGGDATGGATVVLAKTNTMSSLPSSLTFNGSLSATSFAFGGDGGSLTMGSNTTGGAGGNAEGGTATVFADAGNGQLTVNGVTNVFAVGIGGVGGDGDIGGAGGSGQGGFVQFGTRSGAPSTSNTGTASFAGVVSIASGVGGDGGQGFVGAGGAGGAGASGRSTLLVRGSTVNIAGGGAQLSAFGTGGNGGTGASGDGVGGDGIINGGGVAIVASNRFETPNDRGTLNADAINGLSRALGGTGSTSGDSILATQGATVSFLGADGDIGSLSINVEADQVTSTTPDLIEIKNGNLDVGSFSFVSPNDLVLDLDTATLTAADYLTDTRSIQLPATAPAMAGTIIATNSFAIFTDLGADTLTFVNFDVAGGINFNNPGNFQTGNLDVDGDIVMTTVGNLVTGNLTSTGQISLTTNGNQTVGNVSSGGSTFFGVDGALTAGQVQTGGGFSTFVDGAQTIGNVVAGGAVDIRGLSAITVGSIMAAASAYVISTGGVVTTGAITAGDPALTDGRRFGIGLRGSSVTTGNLATPGAIISAAENGTQNLGNVSSGSSILLFSTGNLTTGSLSGGTDAGETVYIGGTDNLARLGAGDDFQPIIAVDPTPTGGSVTLGGPVSADTVLAASSGGFTAGQIAASSLLKVRTSGLLSVNGPWQAPFVSVAAGDIAISQAGRLQAPGGEVEVISTNSNGSFIGSGSASSGQFVLDNAEFGRVSGGAITIGQVDTQGTIDMTIGDLTIVGSQISSSEGDGFVDFYVSDTIDRDGEAGGMRVNGNVAATGFTDDMELDFNASLFELNAATGSITVAGSTSGSLGGIIEIEADRIHVASEEILQRLRENPLYEGRAADLNQPGGIDRPQGVLRARGIEFFPAETLYIQNTGTASNPAGFFTTVENSDIEPPGFEDPEASDVDVIINGRFVSESGEEISGQDAFQTIVDNAESLEGFTATSQVNGCSFDTGSCGPVVVEPEKETPPPTNAAEIDVLTEDQSEEEPFDTEEEEEDAEEAAQSPITPPVVLINTSPLNPDVDVTDPVSGTGNPALIGASISQDAQGDQ